MSVKKIIRTKFGRNNPAPAKKTDTQSGAVNEPFQSQLSSIIRGLIFNPGLGFNTLFPERMLDESHFRY